ncbi:YlmH family RNA-binding protein [Oscillibacter sp.]|uniref:YlmH family RNA-binding protein n=1 Tax=Oscillibacter sp. TaxID=1945593 RepID=UPI002D7EB0D9|nr:YlmH/Sll1252 family protein [Oscillibacter sp.]
MDKGALLDRFGLTGEDRLALAKVLDRAEQADSRNIPTSTDFLSPQQRSLAVELLRLAGISESSYVLQGGYEGAERQVILFLPDWMEAEDAESPIRCLRAEFREEEKLTHRDFLGSILGLGVVREKIGDILVAPDSADLLALEGVADFLLQSWDSAGRAKLRVRAIEPDNLHIPAVRRREVRDTVSSLRLDAVASSGFRLARGKAAALIESGKVQLNWRECVKPDKLLEAGDVVSARGFGKFELSEVGGPTRKGRISIVLQVYV